MGELLEYSMLLGRVQDPAAEALRDYLASHQDNHALLKQAEKLNALFLLQSSLEPTAVIATANEEERTRHAVLAETCG